MTKKILAFISLGFLLSACGSNTGSLPIKTTETPKKDVFTSVKDALTKNLTIKCSYDDNGQKTTTYIKGKMVRFSGTGKEAGVEGVMKDNKFYLWNSNDKKGLTIDLSKMAGAKMGETPIKNIDDVVAQIESKKENCSVSTESDSMFDVPKDITFGTTPDLFGTTK